MNVVSIGTVAPPPPAVAAVQRPAAAEGSRGAGTRPSSDQGRPSQQREERRPAPVETPPLRPVTTQEFRVMLGMLPVRVVHEAESKRLRGEVDLYA